MRDIIVKSNDANQRLDKFISKALPNLPKSLMYKYIRNKKIKVNGKRCVQNQMLVEQDVVRFYIAEEFFEVERDMSFLKSKASVDVIFEDDNIIVMNKPVGLLSHGDENESVDTLVNRMKHYLYVNNQYRPEDEHSFVPALVNRLDRNTQGLVIGAKHADCLRVLNENMRTHRIEKYYLALIEGHLECQSDTWTQYHHRDEKIISIADEAQDGYKEIQIQYQVLKVYQDVSLVEVKLISGKTHQIRAQFANHHHPLVGDSRYGSKIKQGYQALCAYRIVFSIEDDTYKYLNKMKFKIELKNTNIQAYLHKLHVA